VNRHIREIAGRYTTAHEASVFGFICSCGCFGIVELTLGEYDALEGDVFAAGHAPLADRHNPPVREQRP